LAAAGSSNYPRSIPGFALRACNLRSGVREREMLGNRSRDRTICWLAIGLVPSVSAEASGHDGSTERVKCFLRLATQLRS
jgi:hypothetical protein